MNQPDLGKKIAELRKAKGFTQDELVEKCNLNVRTLQRIESGEANPRGYTLKTIFTALDYNDDSIEMTSNKFKQTGLFVSNWLEQLYKHIFDLFYFKTNKMKKITILSIIFFLALLGLYAIFGESKAQKAEKAIKAIDISQKLINKWINRGQIDSALTFYRDDACDISNSLCGKAALREALKASIENDLKIMEFYYLSISVSDSIAIGKYLQEFKFGGNVYKQKGLTEWRFNKGKWLIVNDIYINQ